MTAILNYKIKDENGAEITKTLTIFNVTQFEKIGCQVEDDGSKHDIIRISASMKPDYNICLFDTVQLIICK